MLLLYLRCLHPYSCHLDSSSSSSKTHLLATSSQKPSWTSPLGCVITASHANPSRSTSLATLSCLSPSPEYDPLEGMYHSLYLDFPLFLAEWLAYSTCAISIYLFKGTSHCKRLRLWLLDQVSGPWDLHLLDETSSLLSSSPLFPKGPQVLYFRNSLHGTLTCIQG